MKSSRTPMLITAVVLVFFYLPMGLLVLHSFNESRYSTSWQGFTWKWYELLWQREDVWDAFRRSLVIAVVTSISCMALGTCAALALHRYRSRLQNMHHLLLTLPLVMPEVLIGMSLLSLFVVIKIPLSMTTIAIAHITFCLGYVALAVRARLQDFDFSLMEAARDLGASRWQAMRNVLLPLLAPGILAGGLLAFTLSIDDFVVTFFVSGPGADTLPVKISSMIRHSKDMPVINALSTLLLIATVLIVAAIQSLISQKHR
jgi:spermidine/putrescine transport system permease protein